MKQVAILIATAVVAAAHPMGNFSVNHYARLEATAGGVQMKYVLDLAELPTFDLLRSWKLERTSPRDQLEAKAREEARGWLENLRFTSDGRPVLPALEHVELAIADGAGNLPIMRITSRVHLDVPSGALAYEDSNFPDRAGWKEIVIVGGHGATLSQASQMDKDISKGLTEYPPDPTLAPPQDLRAELKWSVENVVSRATPRPVVAPIPQPHRAPVGSPPAAAAPGTVVRGDFLSKMLHRRDLTPWMIFIGIGVAFLLGAAHALTPGHGKTIVAAYLVGSRGTVRHALFLGAIVTFTHTISVFALGLATLFLFRYVMPDKIVQVLGAVSGLSIVAIGAWMLFKRLRSKPHHHHHHNHHGPAGHAHTHTHTHPHTHMPDELSWTGLVALGASGGLVPCESALILLLGAIALGRVGLGLVLLVSFSLGLAVVLMGIGAIVLFAKNLLPERKRSNNHPVFRWVPVASAAVVVIVGFLMTGVSLGWIRTPIG